MSIDSIDLRPEILELDFDLTYTKVKRAIKQLVSDKACGYNTVSADV